MDEERHIVGGYRPFSTGSTAPLTVKSQVPPRMTAPSVRWQFMHILFTPAVEEPTASDLVGRQCLPIWVDVEDWHAFQEWQRANTKR